MLRFPLVLAFAAGLVSATGFAPLDLWPVAIACLALLLALVHAAPGWRSAALRGWLFGLGHFAVGNNWIQHAFDYQDKMPPALGYLAVLLLAVYLAVYPALAMAAAWAFAHAGARRGGGRPAPRPDTGFVLAAGAAWIAAEYLRATLFTGYPWNPLGVLWVPTPAAGLAAWLGTYALSGLTIVVAGMVALAAHRRWRAPAAAAAMLGVAAIAAAPPAPAPETAPTRRVRIVQPDIGQDGVNDPGYAERVLARLIALSGAPGPAPRLLVWPEGMVNQLLEDGYPGAYYFRGDPRVTRARIAALLGPRDQALVSGNALLFDARGQLVGAGNSVWPIDSSGMLGPRYDKAHLVPYGEYLPMRTLLAPLGLARLVMGDVDFLPGPGPRSLDVPGFGRAGIQVCYEIIFSGHTVDRTHRPDFIYNPSNDAWFGSWGPPQHLAQARLRAIEEGLPVLRATPTGISALVDAHGRLLGTVPHLAEGAIDLPLPPPAPPTPFARFGNAIALGVALALLALAIAFRRRAR